MQKKLLLVDGMALLFRGYYATAYSGGYVMKTSYGLPTNGVFQMVKYFWNAVKTFEPTHVICCWDMGQKTFRSEMLDSYKSNRSTPPDDLMPQFDLAREMMEAYDMPNVGVVGFEADDCIGTLAKQYAAQGMDVVILTGDHDALQLVDDRISVAIMKKGVGNYQVYTPSFLMEEKGVTPLQFIDVKAFMGDQSDQIPGVKGIGEKTALKLIQDYGSVDGVLENLSSLSKGVQTKIKDHVDMLRLSYDLSAIRLDVPIDVSEEDARWNLNEEKVLAMFKRLEFNSMVDIFD